MLTTVASRTTMSCATPTIARISQRREYIGSVADIEPPWGTTFVRSWFGADVSEFNQFEPKRFDLPDDPRVVFPDLRHHRGESGQGASPQPSLYPNGVHGRRYGHLIILLVVQWFASSARASECPGRARRTGSSGS